MNRNSFINSQHFQLERLSDGIFAAIHRDGGAAISNAGIIDLGDRTLIFDTFFTPQAAADLRTAAEELFGRPVDAVINSHGDNDHFWGNQSFDPDTDIISTEVTRHAIDEEAIAEYTDYVQIARKKLESAQDAYKAAKDDFQKRDRKVWIDYFQGFLDIRGHLQIRLPNITFTDKFTIYGTDRNAQLIPMGSGHSKDDTVLFLPEAGILFLSDLLFIDCHPYFGSGNPENLVSILETARDMNPKIVVPGHGPVGGIQDIAEMIHYVETLDEITRELLNKGASAEEIAEISIPDRFNTRIFTRFFPLNMKFLALRKQEGWTGS